MQHSRSSFFLALVFSAAVLPRIHADELPPLRWGADAEGGAPYIFKDPADASRNIGLEVDLAAALAKELGRPITFRQYNYESLLPGLAVGQRTA